MLPLRMVATAALVPRLITVSACSSGGRAADPVAPGESAEAGETAEPVGEARYLYLINSHPDELTVSTHPTIGAGYGGFGVCHPGGD